MCKQQFKKQFLSLFARKNKYNIQKKHRCREQKIKFFRRSRTLCQNNTIFKTRVLHVLRTMLAYCGYK